MKIKKQEIELPKFLFCIKYTSDQISRSNSNNFKYDSTNSNLICNGIFSLKLALRIISIFYITLHLLISVYLIWFNEEISTTNKDEKLINIGISSQVNRNFDSSDNIRNIFLILFNLVTFCFLLISSYNYNPELASTGLALFHLTFIVHLILFIVAIVYYFMGKLEEVFSVQSFIGLIPLLLLIGILIEFYFVWITYKFTCNVILGNDAYVSGEYFNKYVENLASSRSSSLHGTPKKESIYNEFRDDYY